MQALRNLVDLRRKGQKWTRRQRSWEARRTALAPFGCEEVKIKHGEEEDNSADKLVVPNFPDETLNEVQRHSGSRRNQKRDDKQG